MLRYVERPDPVPTGDQVLVQVEACGCNMADVLLCRGTYQERPATPFTPGIELAGQIVAIGPTSTLRVGERVVGTAALPHGGLADLALLHGADAWRVPDDVAATVAAATHVTYQTAWFGLVRRARLVAGEVLLVHAGAGGAGSAAIDLGRHLGARVLATAGGQEKVQRCRALGAEVAWDHRTTDVRSAVLEATDGRGADVVYDTVGGASFHTARRALAFEGRLVIVGFAGGSIAEAPTNHLLVKNYDLLGLHWSLYKRHDPAAVAAAHRTLTDLLRAGALHPLIGEHRPMGEAPEALDDLAAGRTEGKVVLVAPLDR